MMRRLVILGLCASILYSQQWQRLLDVPSYGIAVNPRNPTTLYVGGAGRELYRSYDAGRTWDTLVVDFRSATTQFTNLLVHPIDTNVVFIGGIRFGSLRRSNDNGQSWEQVLAGTQNYVFSGEALIVDPNNFQILYAAEFLTSTVFRSTDRGRTWHAMGSIPADSTISPPRVPRLCCIALRPDSTGILYAGCQGAAIYRSDDSGRTWHLIQRFYYTTQLGDTEIPQIRFSSLRPNVGYAVMTYFFSPLRPNGGLYRTTDGGWSWHLYAYPDTSLWAVGLRSRGDRDEIIVGGFTDEFDTANVVPGAGIVRRSVDEGRTWQPHDNAIPWMPSYTANAFAFRYVTEGTQTKLYFASEAGFFVLNLTSDEPLPSLERPRVLVAQPSREILQIAVDDPTIPLGTVATAIVYTVRGDEVARAALHRYGQRSFYGEVSTASLAVGVYFVRVISGDPIGDAIILIGN